MATITIIREKRFFGSLVSWDVAIGGQSFGTIASGQTLQVQVPPGKHAVSVSKRHTNVIAMVEATVAAPVTIHVRPIKPSVLTFLLPMVWIMMNRTRLIEMHAPGQCALAQSWPGYVPNSHPQAPHMGYPPPPGVR